MRFESRERGCDSGGRGGNGRTRADVADVADVRDAERLALSV